MRLSFVTERRDTLQALLWLELNQLWACCSLSTIFFGWHHFPAKLSESLTFLLWICQPKHMLSAFHLCISPSPENCSALGKGARHLTWGSGELQSYQYKCWWWYVNGHYSICKCLLKLHSMPLQSPSMQHSVSPLKSKVSLKRMKRCELGKQQEPAYFMGALLNPARLKSSAPPLHILCMTSRCLIICNNEYNSFHLRQNIMPSLCFAFTRGSFAKQLTEKHSKI